MSQVSDLVQDTKLFTHFKDSITIHTFRDIDTERGHFNREEHWKREQHLGRGGFGQVYLQKCVVGTKQGSMRAVKVVHKPADSHICRSLDRELEAIAKFSHDRVSIKILR
jgi:serine/threonine protein kinase